MWRCDRHDRITYCVSHTTRAGGGVITRLSRSKWHVESDDTGKTAECPTLTKAFFWVQHQADLAATRKQRPVARDTFITFRGEPDVCVEYDIDASGPGTGCSVEWSFYGKSPDEHDALKVTQAEEDAIIEACIEAYNDRIVSDD